MIHEFVVPAFGNSKYLETCVKSLKAQTETSVIRLVTSTPSAFISDLAQNCQVLLTEIDGANGIGSDWNAALQTSTADWVTLAHQDDIYYPDYAAEIKKAIAANPDASIIFTDYDELVGLGVRAPRLLIMLKKLLLEFGFLGRDRINSKWSKTNCIRFGCAIPCPAVTLRRDAHFRFDEQLSVNLDWDAWLRKAQSDGAFVWIRKPLMAHRIHSLQESQMGIRSGARQSEDLIMLKRLWPVFLAKIIEKTYRLVR